MLVVGGQRTANHVSSLMWGGVVCLVVRVAAGLFTAYMLYQERKNKREGLVMAGGSKV